MREFGASEREARKTKDVVAKSDVMTFPEAKGGQKLTEAIKKMIRKFYEDDLNSRLMPGKKNFISVKKLDGTREKEQKRLILCNLSELYASFATRHENVKFGFSKFAQLRPKYCVLAKATGTHNVCVCVYH